MACGIVIVDKPAGWTSQDVASKLRGVYHERRIGHGDTLDPMATGVLPVFVGRATRAVEFFESAEKEYVAGLRLGQITNTQDTAGEVLETRPVSVTRNQLETALEAFRGPLSQVPPMYSAVKIGGKKLYELARKGQEVERPARQIVIHELELLDGSGSDWLLRIRCSKGTYVRTLCHDIGMALGCGGCMSSLRRTMAGRFTLQDRVPLERLVADPAPEQFLLPTDALFSHLPACTLHAEQLKPCRNGAPIPMPGLKPGTYRVYGPDGEFLMVGRWEKGRMYTEKSFFEV